MDQVKELRDKTGISVMQCRKALEQAEGFADQILQTHHKINHWKPEVAWHFWGRPDGMAQAGRQF